MEKTLGSTLYIGSVGQSAFGDMKSSWHHPKTALIFQVAKLAKLQSSQKSFPGRLTCLHLHVYSNHIISQESSRHPDIWGHPDSKRCRSSDSLRKRSKYPRPQRLSRRGVGWKNSIAMMGFDERIPIKIYDLSHFAVLRSSIVCSCNTIIYLLHFGVLKSSIYCLFLKGIEVFIIQVYLVPE